MRTLSVGFSYIAISQIITIISGFGITIFLTRYLGKDLYGIYSLVITGIITIALKVISSGFPETLSKFISEEKKDNSKLISQILIYQLIEAVILTLIFIGISPIISFTLEDRSLIHFIILASFIIIGQAVISFLVSLYNGLRKFRMQSVIVTILAFVKICSVILGAILDGVLGAILGFLISTLVVGLFFIILSRKYISSDFKFEKNKEIFQYMFRITLFNLGITLIMSMDLIFIQYLLDTNGYNFVGIYNAGASISRLIFFLVISISGVMFPTISNLIANYKKEEAKIRIGEMVKLASIIVIPISFILSSLSKYIVEILYKIEYLDSSLINTVLVIGYTFLGMFVVFSNIINATGEVKTSIYVSLGIIVLDIVLLYVFVRFIGLIGAAIATTIVSFLGFIIIFFITLKKIGMKINKKSILLINSFSIFIFGLPNYLLAFLTDLSFLYLIPIVIGEILLYLILLRVFKEYNILDTLKDVYRIFQRKKTKEKEEENLIES